MTTSARVLLLFLSLPLTVLADWNDFLGPERNGKSQEKIEIAPWRNTGPPGCMAQEDRHQLRGTHHRRRTIVYLRTARRHGAPYLFGKHDWQRNLAF